MLARRDANWLTGPAIGTRHGDESFDFRAEADAAIAVRFIANMHNASAAVRFLGLISGDFDGHAQRGFDRHTYLERRGSGEIKSALRNVKGFGEVFALVRGKAHCFEPNGRAHRIT